MAICPGASDPREVAFGAFGESRFGDESSKMTIVPGARGRVVFGPMPGITAIASGEAGDESSRITMVPGARGFAGAGAGTEDRRPSSSDSSMVSRWL